MLGSKICFDGEIWLIIRKLSLLLLLIWSTDSFIYLHTFMDNEDEFLPLHAISQGQLYSAQSELSQIACITVTENRQIQYTVLIFNPS